MQAHGDAFSAIRNNYQYKIPFFQRRYVWKEENWEELLNSLSDKNDCPFLGSVILQKHKDANGKLFWTVIDGQQRLTTFSVLMRACFDELKKIQNTPRYQSDDDDENLFFSEVQDPFRNTIYYFKDPANKKDKSIKIQHSLFDRLAFEKVMTGKLTDADKSSENKIIQCYFFFQEKLENNIDLVDTVWGYLTRKIERQEDKDKYLVIIELDPEENEQAIFDTINSAGVRLTLADTIKNSMFQKYIELFSQKNPDTAQETALKLYKEHWELVFSDSEDSIAYWNKERSVGRIQRDNIEILLHCIAVIKGFFDPSKHRMEDLPKCYKEYFSALSCKELEDFIIELHDYATLYKNNLETMNYYEYDSNNTIPRLMHIVDTLDISTFMPYILYLLKTRAANNKFIELERYLLLHAICRESTKNYNKECAQLINGTSDISSLLSTCYLINKNNFEYYLCHLPKNNKLQTLLLFWIELYKRMNDTKSSVKKLPYEFSLEHIMPQTWQTYWDVNSLPVYDAAGNMITNQQTAEAIRAEAVYQIGNMTLLNKGLNSSARNYDFNRKVKELVKHNNGDLIICQEVCQNTEWDERYIRARSTELIQILNHIWNFF